MELQVPVAVQTLLSALRQAGFEAYAVGGCVRDTLLQKQPHDWDHHFGVAGANENRVCRLSAV